MSDQDVVRQAKSEQAILDRVVEAAQRPEEFNQLLQTAGASFWKKADEALDSQRKNGSTSYNEVEIKTDAQGNLLELDFKGKDIYTRKETPQDKTGGNVFDYKQTSGLYDR